MAVEFLRSDQAIGAVRRHMRLGSCPALDTRFEILRATVWSIAAPTSKVHVNRLLSAALPTWRLLSECATPGNEPLRAQLRDALCTLDDAGDLISLSNGYWAPAATRLVVLPGGAGYLLVGGAPSSLLELGDAIQFHGPHRHLARLPEELRAALPLEAFDTWARRPQGASLLEWARAIFESFERAPYTPSNADAFEFYLPTNSKPGTPQFFRWFDSAENITGTLLARRRRVYGAREYRLVDVSAGQIVGVCELLDVDVRRLMYALDLAAENPVRAHPTRFGNQTEWRLRSELPRAEQRAFAAFGTLAIPDERRFERRWTFTRNEQLALDMLRSLGIALGRHF